MMSECRKVKVCGLILLGPSRVCFFFQAEDGIRDLTVTGVQTCALPICLYGVRLGGVFFGESMFSRARDASKAALAHLVAVCRRNTLAVIDCQLPSRHLTTLGSRTIPRSQFQALLREHVRTPSAALAPP